MTTSRYLISLLVSTIVLVSQGCSSDHTNNSDSSVELDSRYYQDIYGWNQHRGLDVTFLGRGINMGNYLESPSYEGEWNNDLTIQAEDFINIRDAGFASVRIPIRWSAHSAKTAPFQIDPKFIYRVQEVVQQAIDADLRVVINTHHYDELFYTSGGFPHHRQRLIAMWSQLATHFPLADYPQDMLVFELLNEPHAEVGSERWNLLIDDLLTLLWEEHAAEQNSALGQRKIMIGTADWGGPFMLPKLKLPDSATADNTIITVHFYEPFQFTHQGAEWVENANAWRGTRWLGTTKEQRVLYDYLNAVSKWNSQPNRGYEINIGEFGVYSKHARAEDQKAWTAFIARESEKRGFSWHYWEYSSGFGAYDPTTLNWRPALIQGLIPQD
ncbi:glycoside hydrolase family 5 protein [Vibrio sp. WXL103]|uniref:glycoside hydrolase family 5 protein n=1 Tax=Vibrio sp. WXL103 TaxID=3450710 RepID=UPI003EC551CE